MRELQAQIERINKEISSAGKQRDSLQEQLRSAELEQARINRAIDDNRAVMARQQEELGKLDAEQARLQAQADQQQERIAQELRTAWKMGRQAQLQVLLNQESPDTVARSLGYYRYFYRARAERLEAFRDTLRALDDTGRKIAETLASLEANEQTLQGQLGELAKAQENRQQALAELDASIADKGTALKKLEAERQELQDLLDAIRKAIVDIEIPEDFQPFKAARGKMPWPVPGRASARFGNPRNEGRMRWQGVTIPAEAGTPVKAIHHGRVVYADWLRGMGLLIIVDHGDGYLSLYAHNQTLLREVGEWVGTGSTLGTVGDSGGQGRPALYFEVREKGKPVNPALWCRR
ncbi:hypothetical protein E4634_13950 [Mangrovimicrobium sediminis]|uniref:M23ase beta-sheet core domain-containing protein n=1 Tax=Mangrovimicrobium sediminis TaxID=2562682 RepID=A0A4Z0LZ24_9GAMM|nr:peptidoglycan DD-metalloendopeptidase family protein [Haliea sp. SAOS-164]TGD72623.1 hypothetical protein E4634_13950 [Haliea sp. SAOS-164]